MVWEKKMNCLDGFSDLYKKDGCLKGGEKDGVL